MIIAETVLLTTLLIVSMLAVGTLLDLRAIARVVRRPRPLATGIAVNVVLVPLVALAAIELFGLPPAAGLALFLAAVASGGGSGPLLAHHARGDLALSASLQGMLALSSVAIVPGWLMLAGPRFPAETALQAPGTALAAVALFQLAPLVVGVALRWRWLLMADRVHAVARRGADVLLLTVVAWFLATNIRVLGTTGTSTFVAMLVVVAASMISLAIPAVGDRASRRGSAMVGLVRNLSLALAIAGLATEPGPTSMGVLTYGFLMYLGAAALLVGARCQVAGPAGWRCLTPARSAP